MKKVKVVQSVLKANATVAESNRQRLASAGCVAVNLMSAPGSGKTTLLERTLMRLAGETPCAVLVGDLQTTRDADRLYAFSDHVTQINTGRGCHLDAAQVAAGLDTIDLPRGGFVFIENVGNMVCPAAFDLGETHRVVLLSTPEGDDKVAKYPTLFQAADAVLLTKTDLIDVLGFERRQVLEDLAHVNSSAPLLELAVRKNVGLSQWLAWLHEQRAALQTLLTEQTSAYQTGMSPVTS